MLSHFAKRHRTLQASTPDTSIERSKYQVLRVGTTADDGTDQPVEIDLVRDQRVTFDAESACLPQKDQAEIIDMNHQR